MLTLFVDTQIRSVSAVVDKNVNQALSVGAWDGRIDLVL